MRLIKSPAEIALIREATRSAGLGIMEAMRSAAPGMYEYQVGAVADYVFTQAQRAGRRLLRPRRHRHQRRVAALSRAAVAAR